MNPEDLEKMRDSGPPVEVKQHHYFVMGDNRGDSSDSRDWGLVPEKYIYGKVFFRYWRPSKFGFLEKGETELHEVKEQPNVPEYQDDRADDSGGDDDA